MNRLVPVMFVKVFHVGSFVCICPDGYEQIGPSDVCQGIPHPLISLCVVLAVHCSSSAYFCHRFLSLVTVITMDTTVGWQIWGILEAFCKTEALTELDQTSRVLSWLKTNNLMMKLWLKVIPVGCLGVRTHSRITCDCPDTKYVLSTRDVMFDMGDDVTVDRVCVCVVCGCTFTFV